MSGDTSAGGLARLDWALGDGADAAIVELGANDGLRGVDPTGYREEPERDPRHAGGAAHPGAADAACMRMPNLGPDYAAEFRARVRPAGDAARRAVRSVLPDGVAEVPALNQPDGLHPNAEGVKRIVDRLLPLVEKLLAEVPPA